MMKNVLVRNSTAEFLTFIAEGKEEGIQVLYKNESIWATQKAMSMLFDCSSDNIGLHLKKIFEAVLNCLFEGLRVKNFSFDRFFQGR